MEFSNLDLHVCFSLVSRRATSAVPFSKSRGPMATRTGTPLDSHSANLNPGRSVSRLSSFTEIPLASSFSFSFAYRFGDLGHLFFVFAEDRYKNHLMGLITAVNTSQQSIPLLLLRLEFSYCSDRCAAVGIYYSTQIFLLGAESTKAYASHHGSHRTRRASPAPPGDRERSSLITLDNAIPLCSVRPRSWRRGTSLGVECGGAGRPGLGTVSRQTMELPAGALYSFSCSAEDAGGTGCPAARGSGRPAGLPTATLAAMVKHRFSCCAPCNS